MTAPTDLSWTWQARAGRWVLVNDAGIVMLAGKDFAHIVTADLESGRLLPIVPSDPVAKIIAAAPDLRRHVEVLVNGVDMGLVSIQPARDETVAAIVTGLRLALKKSEAS